MKNSEFHEVPYLLGEMITEIISLKIKKIKRIEEEARLIGEINALEAEEARLIEEENRLIEEKTKRIKESTEEIKRPSKNDAFISTIKEREKVTGKTQAEILKVSLNLYYNFVLNS
jgi:hypothetical protein